MRIIHVMHGVTNPILRMALYLCNACGKEKECDSDWLSLSFHGGPEQQGTGQVGAGGVGRGVARLVALKLHAQRSSRTLSISTAK